MKWLPILISNLRRKKMRSLLTLLSILIAFLLYGYLSAVDMAFSMGVDLAGADRLIVRHRVSLIQPLPLKYEEQMARVPGVVDVTHATWFGGNYQEPRNFFPQFPVEPEAYLNMYPEFIVSPEALDAWKATRTGAIVGKTTADRYGFKVGDRVPIQASIWTKKDGSLTWEFDIVGIYEGAEKGTDTTQFLFRYDYFDETRAFGEGLVGWYMIRVADPSQSEQVAQLIDETFANSPAETKTETEKAFVQAFAKQVGNIGAIIIAILSAVFFTILLITANTMAQAVRERVTQFAVLLAVGFTRRWVCALVLMESCLFALVGGALGLTLAWILIARGDPTHGALPIFFFPLTDVMRGVGLIALLGLVTGIIPAIQATRISVADVLRRA